MLEISINTLTEKILERADDFTIYSHYIPNLIVGSVMVSPLREENKPSFIVKYGSKDNLYHKDYGDDDFYGNCFKFVQQMYNISYKDALHKIDQDLGLGIISGGDPVKIYEKTPKDKLETKPKKIHVEIKSFFANEIIWWGKYGITEKDLEREKIFSIKNFWIEDGRGSMKLSYKAEKEICFGYRFDDDEGNLIGWKIYFPNRENFKWFTSVPNNTIEGWENVSSFRRLFITKSRKDRLVLSKILPNVINSQNESKTFLTEEFKKMLSNFKEIYVWFDSDDPGVKACKKITQEMGWKYINTPKELISEGIKDPAGWVEKRHANNDQLKNFLKQKNLL